MSNETNPFIVKASGSGIEVGSYIAEYGGVNEHDLNGETKWRWVWKVKTGKCQGKEASALTARSISPDSHPGELVKGLLGRPIKAGEDLQESLKSCVGKIYLVHYKAGPKGGKPAVREVGPVPEM